MIKNFLISLISFSILIFNTGVVFANQVIPAGTIIPVSLTSQINSDLLNEGDVVSIKVVKDVYVDGQVVFPKDTVGLANVTKVKHSRHHGGAGYLLIKDAQIMDINKNTQDIQLSMKAEGDGCRGSAIFLSVIGTLLILTPFGIWKHGDPAFLSPAQVYNGIITTQFDL